MACQSLCLCKRELKNFAFFLCFLFLLRIPGYPSGNSDDNVLLSGKFINKKEMVTSISVSPDCKNAAVATGKTIFIVPVNKKESMKVLLNNGNAIEEIKYSNTGKYLLVKDGKKTGYYDFNRNRMIIPPVDYYYDGLYRLYFSDNDSFFIIAAAFGDVGNDVKVYHTNTGSYVGSIDYVLPSDLRWSENEKKLRIAGYKFELFNTDDLKNPVFTENVRAFLKKLPFPVKYEGTSKLITEDGKFILIKGSGKLIKRDFCGREKPVWVNIDKLRYNSALKLIPKTHLILLSGFEKWEDTKGFARIFDYEAMTYVSEKIPVESVFEIAPEGKFIAYLWNGDVKIRKPEKITEAAKKYDKHQ